MSILSELKDTLHPCLLARIHHSYPPPPSTPSTCDDGFVLYLPTVSLRIDQNPSFALACHVANLKKVPLVVLAVVLDDSHHQRTHNSHVGNASKVVMTSRRLAFTLQALSHACQRWSQHGAAVGIRIHASSDKQSHRRKVTAARTPDHLTLAARSLFVVTDEPFVSPYSVMVRKVEEACRKSGVECVRVDGSCTVPPLQVLRKNHCVEGSGVLFEGVPNKAYQWQIKTEHLRMGHLKAAMEGCFDAPELEVTMEDEEMFLPVKATNSPTHLSSELSWGQRLAHLFPSRWKPVAIADMDGDSRTDSSLSSLPNAPDMRPFTSKELSHLFCCDDYFDVDADGTQTLLDESNQLLPQNTKAKETVDAITQSNSITTPFHKFALHWPGADSTVPPVKHTIGTTPNGMARWNTWVQNGGLSRYAKERNDARNNLNGVSRMSAYLNLGIVSIFRLVWEVKQNQTKSGSSAKSKWKTGADKFEEEIVKFREHSYAHAFSRLDYDDVSSLPRWSVQYLDNESVTGKYTVSQLASGATECNKWNSMQTYLVRTGELHNNVRMTWGKSVVEWGVAESRDGTSTPSRSILQALCYLNDRFALDGLSPPSYGGLLWCMGWTDKPDSNGGVSPKPAYRYRMTPDDFEEAETRLQASCPRSDPTSKDDPGRKSSVNIKRQPSLKDVIDASNHSKGQFSENRPDAQYSAIKSTLSTPKAEKRKATIESFFQKKIPRNGQRIMPIN
ncbi:hypothetical protein HJC23_002627 [Cyclotella cryptica]|uniref:Photolyase/cryptochrome alpha/beta domain-containing protein n=1 Tax=Cyclotella cryptica TaxID=29204 RepID=A0ABD3PXH8_9STRA|eukprot:CCRYP_010374-RA/>CCRYP_010374-RA protein AED:0.15 eAED:0.15 QI:0/-1/0/1/-1/1/1/0/729